VLRKRRKQPRRRRGGDLGPDPSREDLLDEGIEETFPASDPVAVPAKGETVWERQQRGRRRR